MLHWLCWWPRLKCFTPLHLNKTKQYVAGRKKSLRSRKPNALVTKYDRYESCCHALTATTVADSLLLCLWVPSLIAGCHTRSSYRALRNSRDMLAPANSLRLYSFCAIDLLLRAAQYSNPTVVHAIVSCVPFVAGGNSIGCIMLFPLSS